MTSTKSVLGWFALLALLALSACSRSDWQTTTPNQVVEVTFAEQPVRLVVPKGYCVLNTDTEPGKSQLAYQQHLMAGINQVALLFVDCRKPLDYLEHPQVPMGSFGNYLIPLTEGKQQRVADSVARTDVLEEFNRSFSKGGANVDPDEVKKSAKYIEERSQTEGQRALSGLKVDALGVLARNEDSLSFGQIVSAQQNGNDRRNVDITTVTLIGGVIVELNVAAPYTRDEEVSDLTALAIETAGSCVLANP